MFIKQLVPTILKMFTVLTRQRLEYSLLKPPGGKDFAQKCLKQIRWMTQLQR